MSPPLPSPRYLFTIAPLACCQDVLGDTPGYGRFPPKWQQKRSSQYTSYSEVVLWIEPHNIEFGDIYNKPEYEEDNIFEISVTEYLRR